MRGTGGDPEDADESRERDREDSAEGHHTGATDDTGPDSHPVDADAVGEQGLGGALPEVVARIREQDVTFRAAAVTYYALASFLPILIVALAVLALVGAQDALVDLLRGSLSGSAVDVVDQALQGSSRAGSAGAVGFLIALWSATKVFRGLSIAFDRLYGEEADPGLLAQTLQGLVVLAFLVLAIAVVSAAGVAAALVPFDLPAPGLVWNLLGLAGLVVGLLPLYYVLPPIDVSIAHALPGAAVAAVGWVLLQFGFSIYVQFAGTYAAYGVLGALLLFVLFLYAAAIVLLVGAVVNVTLSE